MIANQLIKQIKAQRGPVFVMTQNHHDLFWIQAVKSDLIAQFSAKFSADEETGFDIDEHGYMGKD